MIWYITLSTSLAFIGIILLITSAMWNKAILDWLSGFFLCPSIFMVFIINIYTWKKGQPDPLTFNKMVKQDLDEFFVKINNYYADKTKQGIEWQTIDGHFWVEIHLNQDKKIPEMEFTSSSFEM